MRASVLRTLEVRFGEVPQDLRARIQAESDLPTLSSAVGWRSLCRLRTWTPYISTARGVGRANKLVVDQLPYLGLPACCVDGLRISGPEQQHVGAAA